METGLAVEIKKKHNGAEGQKHCFMLSNADSGSTCYMQKIITYLDSHNSS